MTSVSLENKQARFSDVTKWLGLSKTNKSK